MEGIPSSSEEVTTQMALFANWVRSGYMYPNDVIPPSDAIAQTVLFVIDQLPVSLDLSFAKENRFRNDRYPMKLPLTARRLFQSLLSMLQTPKPGSGRFVWVVDTVDENSSISGIRYLLPKLPSDPPCIELKPPSHRM